MIEEFISLLESGKEEALEVLRPQVDPKVLKYLVGGFFDEKQKRLVAYALMPVDKDYFWSFDYLLKFSEGHSAQLFNVDSSREPNIGFYLPGKSLEDEIKDGKYRNNLVSFICEYDFDEWNILTSNCFTDSKNKRQILESELKSFKTGQKRDFFNESIFVETQKHYDDLNYFLKQRHLEHPNPKFPERKFDMKVPTEMKPFIGHSHLVALIRTNKSGEINEAYTSYMQKAVFDPFLIKLKTFFPKEYQRIETFPFNPRPILFSNQRKYCLFICWTYNNRNKIQLKFFLYRQENNKVYEWIYFPKSTYYDRKVKVFQVHEIFKPISKFDSMDYLFDHKCTLDDEDFWNNYVFKKENGEYVYLKEINF